VSDASIGVGVLGYAFMGRAHSSAYRRLPQVAAGLPLRPRLVAIAGRDTRSVAAAASRFGYERYVTDWMELISDPEIQLFDNCGPNGLHAEPTCAAAEAGKHVLCEKPLARNADEALSMWRAVERAGVQHLCGFNYRFVPAVRLARQVLEAGDIGEIHHFRASYLQEWGATTERLWRFDRETAGSGALGDLGAHVIDLARYLVGEVEEVSALVRTFQPDRAVDDAFVAVASLAGGALATFEATRLAPGRKSSLRWEINGSRGSLGFDLERPNVLLRSRGECGFTERLVTEPDDPFMSWWWPPGHVIGWEHTFVHEIEHFLGAIAGRNTVAPHAATFEDGYRVAEVCDAIERSAASGRREVVVYR
jgi:predicted dehydrogenase